MSAKPLLIKVRNSFYALHLEESDRDLVCERLNSFAEDEAKPDYINIFIKTVSASSGLFSEADNEWEFKRDKIIFSSYFTRLVFNPNKREMRGFFRDQSQEERPLNSVMQAVNAALRLAIEYDNREDSIIVHSSGAVVNGAGVVFTGDSGAGKSTIAKMFSPEEVISDEATMLCAENERVTIEPMPIRHDGKIARFPPNSPPLKAIFILKQSSKNKILPIKKSAAVNFLLSGLVQSIPLPEHTRRISETLLAVVGQTDCFELQFTLDGGIIPLIKNMFSK